MRGPTAPDDVDAGHDVVTMERPASPDDTPATDTPAPPTGVAARAAGAAGRWRARGGGRVVGVDVARALALMGMFTQHVGVFDANGISSTGWVAWLFTESAGRASVLFFLLSGVSLSLVHRRGSLSATPPVLRRRGLLLLGGGILLTITIWPASILQHYGVVFLLAPWLLRLGRRGLAALTAAGLVCGPIALLWLPQLANAGLGDTAGLTTSWLTGQLWDLFVIGTYPLVLWIGFFTLGMLVGRLRIETRRVAVGLAAGGVAATLGFGALAGLAADRFGGPTFGEQTAAASLGGSVDGAAVDGEGASGDDAFGDDAFGEDAFGEDAFGDDDFGDGGIDENAYVEGDGVDGLDESVRWSVLADTTGHSGRMGWTLQTSGIAAAILGFALLVPRRLERLLWPLAALGSMSLTAYLVHIVLVTDVWDAAISTAGWSVATQELALAGLVAAMTATCVVFKVWLGAGPLERLLKHFAQRPGDRAVARSADASTP